MDVRFAPKATVGGITSLSAISGHSVPQPPAG
jgi:hypothetical protein